MLSVADFSKKGYEMSFKRMGYLPVSEYGFFLI
jgi:hypothetical protein